MKTPIVDPQSESEILRASTIILIQLCDITFGPWVKEAEGSLMVRSVTMQVIIEEVLKGQVRQRVGEAFELKIQQRGTGDFVVMDYYGLWSHVPLADRARFVAFCGGDSEDATILLTEGYCEQLVEARLALADTKAALELETEDLSSAEILAEAARQTDQRGDIFARYVAAKTKSQALTPSASTRKSPVPSNGAPLMASGEPPSTPSNEAFEAIMMILEDPKTKNLARASYLTSIYESLGMMASPPRELVIRLIQTLFKLLSLREAEPLRDNLREVYLPNLLGLNNPPYRYSASEVFKERGDDQVAILSSLTRETSNEPSSRLIQWLEAKDN